MIIKKNKGGFQYIKNVPLFHHPNPNKEGNFYLIPKNYIDDENSFDEHLYKNWKFSKNDKRNVKRIKKKKAGYDTIK